MGLDVRLPLGLMFTIIGLLLAAYGGFAQDSVNAAGININLWWGLVLLVFGGVMLWLQRRSTAAARNV
jgi:cytochrome c-type biogenesis protein CcmH/NrfF